MNTENPTESPPTDSPLPTTARVLAVIQLCFAFTLAAWICSQPFLGDLFTLKSKMLLYQNVMGSASFSPSELRTKSSGQLIKLKKNEERFAKLSIEERDKILDNYARLEEQTHESFLAKLENMFVLLFFKTPPLELAWIFFSILIPILLLKRTEGAVPSVWLLPVIVFAYAVDNRLNGLPFEKSVDEELFPSEKTIIERYIQGPLHGSLAEQREELKKAWNRYLVEEWAHEAASSNKETFQSQVEDGEYAFNVARLDKQIDRDRNIPDLPTPKKVALWVLAIYLFWNILFAIVVYSSCRTLENMDNK